jgi:hypothetical protein
MFWGIADRWGRVTTDGVLVPVRLTHATLAELVGASRPSVSTVLKLLERDGLLARRKEGWLLHGEAPPALGTERDWQDGRRSPRKIEPPVRLAVAV